MIHKTFEIGQWVEVVGIYTAHYEGNERRILRTELAAPKFGQVVGIARRYTGRRSPGCYDEPPSFEANKAIVLIKVAISWIQKPIEAMPADIKPAESRELPYNKIGSWTDADRSSLRSEMAKQPRDQHGRWLKAVSK